jgi:DNA-binding winged helix-turn-helix (wHTH) protein
MKSMRRSGKAAVRLDLANACLWRGKQRMTLQPKDLAVLRYLVEHAGQLVSKTALLAAAWPGVVVTETVLKACINRLRQARRMLAEIYGWFTEGFNTADLQEAKALLDK